MSLAGGLNEVQWARIVLALDRHKAFVSLAELQYIRMKCGGDVLKALQLAGRLRVDHHKEYTRGDFSDSSDEGEAEGEEADSLELPDPPSVSAGEFVRSAVFDGSRLGSVFKSGTLGVGYYRDMIPIVAAPDDGDESDDEDGDASDDEFPPPLEAVLVDEDEDSSDDDSLPPLEGVAFTNI